MQQAIGIEIKRLPHLWNSRGAREYLPGQPPQRFVFLSHRTHTLQNVVVTAVWLSAAVEKIWLFLEGIVGVSGFRDVITEPRVSFPKKRSYIQSRTTLPSRLRKDGTWIPAPMATTSSGLSCGCFLPKISFHSIPTQEYACFHHQPNFLNIEFFSPWHLSWQGGRVQGSGHKIWK